MIAAKGGPSLQQIAEHPLELGGFIASELAMSADLLASTKFKMASHTQLAQGKSGAAGINLQGIGSDRLTQTNNLRQNHRRKFAVSTGRSTTRCRKDHSRFGQARLDADRG